jgi:hypothetical protein
MTKIRFLLRVQQAQSVQLKILLEIVKSRSDCLQSKVASGHYVLEYFAHKI